MASVIHRISEFFLLRDVRQRAEGVSDEERARVASVCTHARQKRDAAEALWVAGFPAEALRLANEGLELVGAAHGEVTAEHTSSFNEAIGVLDEHLARKLGEALDHRAIRTLRANRIAIVAGVAISLIGAALIFLRTPRMLKAEASAQWDARYDASKAVDGSDKTDWLLPDKATGWLDVRIVPARKIRKLEVTNARNLPFSDRATNEFHVDIYDKGTIVKQFDARFDGFSAQPSVREFDIGIEMDRVRLTVKSHHLSGGGFGEVEVVD